MDALRDIALFVEVARAANFSAAAVRLGMPVSSLSRRIAELERSIGLQLLKRTTRSVALTEAGALYLARCQGIVEEAATARRELQGLAEAPRGILRASLTADFGSTFLAPLVAEYAALYPEVRIELDLGPRRVDLVAETFDIALRLGALPDSSLTVRRLAELPSGLFASPDYLREQGTPRQVADLSRHARLRLLHVSDRGDWRLTSGNEHAHVATDARVAVNNMALLRELARLGAGIAVLDEVMVRADVEEGSLRRVLPEWAPPTVPVSAMTPGRMLPAKTRAFIELVARHLGPPARRGA